MSSGCAGSGASWTCTGSQRGGTIRPPLSTSQFIWEPTPDYVENARVTAFMREHEIADWRELHRRSVEDIGWFWDAVVKHLGIEFFEPYAQVVDESRGPRVDARGSAAAPSTSRTTASTATRPASERPQPP